MERTAVENLPFHAVPDRASTTAHREFMHIHHPACWRTLLRIAIVLSAVAIFAESSLAQYGYGIRGAGGMRANGIGGSGGLRGNSIIGSGGLGCSGYLGQGVYGTPASSMPRTTSRLNTGYGSSTSSRKPFSSYSAQPTVSPYLNLFRTDLNGGGNFNYSTLVQPQLQQQQMNQQLERQNSQTNRRLQSLAAQADYNPQGSKDQYPTGHQTVFNYMGHYYQPAQVKQKRRGP